MKRYVYHEYMFLQGIALTTFFYSQEEKQRSAFEMLQFQTDSRLNRIKKEVNRPMISNIRNGINNCMIYRKKF